jgi:hypothetical protein
MLQLKNRTRYAATLFPSADPDGVDTLFAIVKGTFTIGPRVEDAESQTPIVMADRFSGDPLKTSISEPGDISLAKPGTDILLFGHAYGPGGRPTTRAEVSLRVGPTIEKRAVVFGDRRWGGTVLTRISAPEPFERMPLVWERAFGGTETLPGDPPRSDGDERNPVGAGFRSRTSGLKLEGIALPNLEDPGRLISSPGDRPVPVGFGAVAPHWKPRPKYAGTYDEAWQRDRAPYLPKDFDPRFLQFAPEDQQVPGYLKGGEPVEVAGATPSGALRFNLPARRVEVLFRLDSGEERRSANLDTVIIHPDASRLVLVWRAALPCDKRLLKVREVEPIVARAA